MESENGWSILRSKQNVVDDLGFSGHAASDPETEHLQTGETPSPILANEVGQRLLTAVCIESSADVEHAKGLLNMSLLERHPE